MNIGEGMAVGKGVFQFLSFLKGIVGVGIISSYFRFDGTRVEGSSKINVELIKSEDKKIFWLNVSPIDSYVFVRFAINDGGCEELIGTEKGEVYPNPNYWRWVEAARSGTIVGGNYQPPNAKVDFVIVGYKPKAITKHLSKD